jgi:hypothetical protein
MSMNVGSSAGVAAPNASWGRQGGAFMRAFPDRGTAMSLIVDGLGTSAKLYPAMAPKKAEQKRSIGQCGGS